MCLLLTRKGGTAELNEAWLRDFYKRNDDGFGFMYASEGHMFVDKSLGKVDEFIEKWRKYEAMGIDFVAHLRMRTHGDVSLENCHPYMVLDGTHGIEMWMMHNGVLSNGNDKDKTKSDTWHFINDYMRPLLDPGVGGNPDLIYSPEFKAILGSAIGGGNKLIFLDNRGQLATINKAQGKVWNGMWLSNTYAWSSGDAKDDKSLPVPYSGTSGGYNYGGYNSAGYKNPIGEYIDGKWTRYDSPNHPDHKDYKGAGSKATEKKPDDNKGNLTVINGGKNSEPTSAGSSGSSGKLSFTDEEDTQRNLISAADMFAVLKSAGFMFAHGKITFGSMQAFIKHFEPQVLLDLVELVHAEVIDEQVLSQCIVDYKLAREVLNDGYPPEDVVRRQIDEDVKTALAEAEQFDEKQKEAARIRASDPVIAAAAAASTITNPLPTPEETAAYEAAIAVAAASESAKVAVGMEAAATTEVPPDLPVLETKEVIEMGNKIAEVAKSLEEEPVSEEAAATEQHLAESEAAAQLVGAQMSGAE